MPASTVAAGSAREALGAATDALRAAGVETPDLDAEVMLAAATGVNRAALTADPEAEVAGPAARAFAAMVRRRLRREPVAYILGCKGFRHLDLAVDRRALIPRPETELLVELALERAPRRVLDLGTGCGAIALAVAAELPGCEVLATDTSTAALALAGENAERLGLAARVDFRTGSVPAGEEFDLILANLPYVAETEWPGLAPEVTRWEPREALLAGPDGLDAYRDLLAHPARQTFGTHGDRKDCRAPVVESVAPAGAVALEVGAGQAAAVAEMVRDAGFERTELRCDLAGIERVVVGER